MNSTIDYYVPIIDNYGDIGFALNLALILTSKNPNLKVRFFSDNENLFRKMIGEKLLNINYIDLKDLSKNTPSKTIFTFFDYRLPDDYLKKGKKGKNIVQFGYFLLHKGVENLHGTSYEDDGNKMIHFIPSLLKNTGGIILNNYNNYSLDKNEFLSYFNSKYNLNISEKILEKKLVSVFVYSETLNEILEVIENRKNEIFFIFDSKNIKNIKSENIFYMPFLELLDYNYFLSVCDINIVRGENSLCTSLSYGKPTLWDIYKENNLAHNEKIKDFNNFLGDFGQYGYTLKNFNFSQKKEGFENFLDTANNYIDLFNNLGKYIEQNCNLYKKIEEL